jgi:hypothetical protein
MYLIKHADKLEYMTMYGWKANRDAALQFRTDDDARGYAQTIPSLHGTYIVEKHKDMEVRAAPGVMSDYDPFRAHLNV